MPGRNMKRKIRELIADAKRRAAAQEALVDASVERLRRMQSMQRARPGERGRPAWAINTPVAAPATGPRSPVGSSKT
jgi:hypothetical protein